MPINVGGEMYTIQLDIDYVCQLFGQVRSNLPRIHQFRPELNQLWQFNSQIVDDGA